jgi:hypothetical protein
MFLAQGAAPVLVPERVTAGSPNVSGCSAPAREAANRPARRALFRESKIMCWSTAGTAFSYASPSGAWEATALGSRTT